MWGEAGAGVFLILRISGWGGALCVDLRMNGCISGRSKVAGVWRWNLRTGSLHIPMVGLLSGLTYGHVEGNMELCLPYVDRKRDAYEHSTGGKPVSMW